MPKYLFGYERIKRLGSKIVEYAKTITLPFFDRVPLYDVSLFFWRSIVNGALTTRASAIAFSFFLALFPAIIFIFTSIPYILKENFQTELFLIISGILPAAIFNAVEETILDILTIPRGNLLSLGFFMALIFSTNGIASMMNAFDASIHVHIHRNWFSQRVTSIFLLFILWVLLTIAIALIAGGQSLLNYLVEHGFLHGNFTFYLLSIGKWFIIIALFFFAYSFLYYMAPAKKTRWRFISAGGTLATVLSIITLVGFGYYINNFSQYNKLYGSIGTLLIILLLMYFLSLILLIGFELNVSIQQAQNQNKE
ncbi:Ribonuclease BN [hydrothermal vent metagenome]|uniref:Ribonuclease BN n=1 Tax=hydrothermal vent metagenome TaxID=652676 RepID=A0A3B0TXU4_9ZZZZ